MSEELKNKHDEMLWIASEVENRLVLIICPCHYVKVKVKVTISFPINKFHKIVFEVISINIV